MRKLTVSSLVAISLWFASPLQVRSQSYNWSTIAGYPLYYPEAVVLSSAGVVYVADVSTVRQVTPLGTNWVVRTLAGKTTGTADGTNSDAQFNGPAGIALDQATNLYVTDYQNHTIRKVTPIGTNWVVTTIAGLATVSGSSDGTNSDARFDFPTGIAVDASGSLFVADSSNSTVRKATPVGTNWVVTTVAGLTRNTGGTDGTNTDARFVEPQGIAQDDAGNLYVADGHGATIRKMTLFGTNWVVSTIAGSYGASGSLDGTNTDARFYEPTGIRADKHGNLYVADRWNDLIRKITPVGTNWVVTTIGGRYSYVEGSQDGIGTNALFFHPFDVAVDDDGNVFVADFRNSTLRLGLASLVTPPSLQIAVAGPQTMVSWPLAATNYVLEASGLTPDSAPWTTITDGVAQNGTLFVLTTNSSGEASYFRLHSH